MNIVEIYKKFPDQAACIQYLEEKRWNGRPTCPYCKSANQTPIRMEHRYHCNNCNTSYSVTVGTIFHKTKLDLQVWFLAISLVLNAKKGISSRQLGRDLGVNKNTSWYMGMRIRKAMSEHSNLLNGIVEMDETYVGGKDSGGKRGRGSQNKTAVVGMIERGGKIKARPVKDVNQKTLTSLVRGNVDIEKTRMITDQFSGYFRFNDFVSHDTINHSKAYVVGDIHTNTIESFWSLLKRGIKGQYHKVSAHHLKEYVDEFCYRHNNRDCDDLFALTVTRALEV